MSLCRRPAWRRAVERSCWAVGWRRGQLGPVDRVERADDRGQWGAQLVADRGNEVALHLCDFLQPPGHVRLGLVAPDLGENEPCRGGQRAELLELVLGEVADVGVADDDHPNPKALDLERRNESLLQSELLEEDVRLGVRVDFSHVEGLAGTVGLGHDPGGCDIEDDGVGVEGIAVHPDRAHHLQPVPIGVVEEHHADLGIEVLANGPDQMGDDLRE